MRHGRRQPLRFCAPARRSFATAGLVAAIRCGLFLLALVLQSALFAIEARAADATASGGSAAGTVSPWATGGASATTKVGDKDGKPGGGADRLAQVPVSQAYPLPGAVVYGTTIPQGWSPQTVAYQAIGPDGRPVTMHYAPTYVFTYPIGPPVPMAQPPRSASQVNRRQAYGQPAAYGQGWNYQTQGAPPPVYTPPPPTVVRYQPPPYQFPPGSGALAGTPVMPPQTPLPVQSQMPAAAPPQTFAGAPSPYQSLAPPPDQWVSSQPGVPAPPPGIGAPQSPNTAGQAFAAAAPPAMAAAAAAIAPPPASSQPPTVPVQPVSSVPQASSGGASPSGRATNSHLWRVVGVHDGDTVTCLDDANQQQKVRLAEIDAPELGQDFGKVSRDALAEMVFGKTVEVVDDGKDRYGRWIGHLIVDGQDANRQMVATGNAWHYATYSQDASLATLQQQAQSQKLGLWSQPNPTAPWDYRKNGKKQAGT